VQTYAGGAALLEAFAARPGVGRGHQERIDGAGYPRGLKRDQMSIPAWIMMIADIFEALTARDGSYKAHTMRSERIDIMARISRAGHIEAKSSWAGRAGRRARGATELWFED
jgi:HD-GYP domain-containing protein (c-di-GMP phosphodiesterase class II)